MEIKQLKISELKAYSRNPKAHPDKQIEKIANSIKEFGFNVPILVDKNNEIIAGHGRYLASQKLGLTEVPVIKIESLTPEQVKAYRIADNRLTESGWEYDFLQQEITDLKNGGFDLSLLGFNDKELNNLFINLNLKNKNIYSDKIKSPVYKIGEIKPDIDDLFDDTKTKLLIKKIKSSQLSINEKNFLIKAAGRFTQFNFDKIADYYAYSNKDMQVLMEELALVIIDFNQAIELGFVNLTKELAKLYKESI